MSPSRTSAPAAARLAVAACALFAATAFGQAAAPGPFDPPSLYPTTPASSVRSFRPLSAETPAWTDLAVFTAVVNKLAMLGAVKLPTDGSPYTVFAPTNEAFLKLLVLNDDPPAGLYNNTDLLFATLRTVLGAADDPGPGNPVVDALINVVKYHVVPLANTEAALKALGAAAPTAFDGATLNVADFPKVTDAEGLVATRYGRSLRVGGNAMLVVIDRVLRPADVKPLADFVAANRPDPPPPADENPLMGAPPTFQRFLAPALVLGDSPGGVDPAPFTYALSSYAGFLSARADLRVFAAVAADVPQVGAALAGADRNVHPLLPKNSAFLALLRRVPVPAYAVLASRFEKDVYNDALLAEVVRLVAAVVGAVPGDTTVFDVVAYHVLVGAEPLADRTTGPQDTLLANATLSIGDRGQYFVQDGDASRMDAGVIASFPTGQGYVSVIDGLLLPLNLDDAVAAVLASNASLPMPSLPAVPNVTPMPGDDDDEMAPSVGPIAPDGGLGGLPTTAGGADEDMSQSAEPSVEPSAESSLEGSPTNSGQTSATPSPTEEDDGVCFPADAKLTRASDGAQIAMADVVAGDVVRTHPADAAGSRVFLFTHRLPAAKARVVRVETASGHVVRATRGHYLYANGGKLVAFGAVRVGDTVRTDAGDSAVTSVSSEEAAGLYAPHALRADLVVDGVWVSGYSRAVRPRVAEALLAPLRFAARKLGLVEPVGGLLYNGANGLLRFIPRGAEAY